MHKGGLLTHLAAWAGSFLFAGVVIFGTIAAFTSPKGGAQASIAAFHVLGNGAGAVALGVGELGEGYREVANAMKDKSYVDDYPKKEKAKAKAKEKSKS